MFDFIVKAIEKATREALERNRLANGGPPPFDPRLQAGDVPQRVGETSQRVVLQASEPPARKPPRKPKKPKSQKPANAPPPLRQRVQSQAAAARGDATRPASASAQTIANWAQPRTLRAQFILTEILKPPLSMREPR
ncbi:hypothetical protein [Humisphaera borealis]|uniref:Uncharacterized protein n=1 Tax=Humisphaera borealis TaxID=2807512 RepID=A0A7M2X169_9BACT|nr:hypothetical protein [Humisphaera borealis]QOV91443.1 hypothetical protein IPV69_08840 [Humisphaera borealis]